ncbi:Carboxylesterase A [Psilocybe cubensis]|uniref:Carboxylesterase A n=1 Tax=Psilocybe cubensis TaxID=181762 RepID=A0ACB8H5G6_PSICU|nr:Carboxylesterase A [Psilocybe cubensis]KAH9483235.1 Carboxylesterase A [Psilocybe cubensis]
MAPNNRWFRSSVFVVASILGIGLFLSARDQRATFNQVQRERQVNDEWQRPQARVLSGRNAAVVVNVPLDYSNPDGEEAIIALARKPAAVPRDSKSYRGPILLNPGGPGGSGVGLIMGQGGDLLRTIVGPEFDLVGFDPRGIARSTPRISFFKTDIERHLFNYASSFLVNNSDEGIHRTLARAKLVGQLAAESDSGYLRHMNTDHTVRDMLRIVEAHGRSKIQYWGFSYVGPPELQCTADRFLTITLDTDKVLDGFFTECAQAGPDNCQFWAPTATHIRRNLTSIFESIRYRPISVKTDSTYGLLDYSKLKQTIFATLYNPYVFFPSLAKALAELVTGNGSTLYTLIPDSIVPECQCDPELSYTSDTDASIAIICNDGEEILEDIDALENHLESSMKISQWGDVMAGFRLNCPFKGKTSHPMLIIGNTADPVTPLWS